MVPTGAGIFSPHLLQRIVKSHCRLSGRLNTNVSIGEQKAKIQMAWPVDSTIYPGLNALSLFLSSK